MPQANVIRNVRSAFVGAQNLWPLNGTLFEAYCLLRMGVQDLAGGMTNPTAYMAQCDDFVTPTAGWGIGQTQTGSIRAFVVDNVGATISSTFTIDYNWSGRLMLFGLRYTGTLLQFIINGNVADLQAMGGVTPANANVVPWMLAQDAAGNNPANDAFQLVAACVKTSAAGNLTSGAVWEACVEDLYMVPDSPLFSQADYVYNARASVLDDPEPFVTDGSVVTLKNQGVNTADALGTGDLQMADYGWSESNALTVPNYP